MKWKETFIGSRRSPRENYWSHFSRSNINEHYYQPIGPLPEHPSYIITIGDSGGIPFSLATSTTSLTTLFGRSSSRRSTSKYPSAAGKIVKTSTTKGNSASKKNVHVSPFFLIICSFDQQSIDYPNPSFFIIYYILSWQRIYLSTLW